MASLLSPAWWLSLNQRLANTTISLSYNRHNRIGRLRSEIAQNQTDAKNNEEAIYEALRKLQVEDYVIIQVEDDLFRFVKFHKMTSHIRIEIYLKKTLSHQKKLRRAIEVIRSYDVHRSISLGLLQLNPDSYYYHDSWTDVTGKYTGNLLVVISKNNLMEATTLGLALLKSAHDWEDSESLKLLVNTMNDSWWNKL